MVEKEQKRKSIMPSLSDLVSTPDLVSEALKKVIGQKAEPQLAEEKTAKKLEETRFQQSSVPTELGSENRALTEPSSNRTEFQQSPALIEPSKNYIVMPQFLLDEIMPTLGAYEQILLLRLYRLSYGFHRNTTDPVGKKALADRCNMSISQVKRALKTLEKKGLIKTIPDKSFDPTKGNRYKVLTRFSENPVLLELGSSRTRFHENPKTDDDDINTTNHHQMTKEIYERLTGNEWRRSDNDAYQKIKDVPLDKIEQGIRLVTQRAASRPNSLNYFVREILSLAKPSEQSKSQRKKALEKIVQRVREIHVGQANYTFPDFLEDVKRACSSEGLPFDNDLFNEILGL